MVLIDQFFKSYIYKKKYIRFYKNRLIIKPKYVIEIKKKIKKNQMVIKVAIYIIKKSVSNNIFNNIINITTFKEI